MDLPLGAWLARLCRLVPGALFVPSFGEIFGVGFTPSIIVPDGYMSGGFVWNRDFPQ